MGIGNADDWWRAFWWRADSILGAYWGTLAAHWGTLAAHWGRIKAHRRPTALGWRLIGAHWGHFGGALAAH